MCSNAGASEGHYYSATTLPLTVECTVRGYHLFCHLLNLLQVSLSLRIVGVDGGNEDDVCISMDQNGMGTKLQSFLKLFRFKRASLGFL